MKYLYAGNSWCDSFPLADPMSTSLAKEWGIPHEKRIGTSGILGLLDDISKSRSDLPIVFLYGEPAINVRQITGIPFREFCQRSDWQNLRENCNQECLKKISLLGRPILLIGGHSDIVNCDYKNITVLNSSWQKWMAQQAGMKIVDSKIYVVPEDGGEFIVDHCFGAELVQKYLHTNPEVSVDPVLDTKLWDIYFFWETLKTSGWMTEAHPTNKSHKEFAKFLFDDVVKFVNQ